MKVEVKKLTALLLILLLTMALAACSGGNSQPPASEPPAAANNENPPAAAPKEKVTLEMMCWAGGGQELVPKEVADYWTKTSGHVTVNVTDGQNAILYPQMVAARQNTPNSPLFNLAYMNAFTTIQGIADDLWVAPDLNNIPNAQNIFEAYRPQQGDMGITWSINLITLYYNPNKVANPPTSWADLWSEEYKGHVAVWDNLFYSFLIPTAYELGGDENNMDAAFTLWANNTDQFYSFYTSVDQLKNLFISEDVWLAPFFVGMGLSWEEEGVPVKMAELENCIAFPNVLQLCAGSTAAQKYEAELLVNELISPQRVEEYLAVSPVIPVMSGISIPAYLEGNYFFKDSTVNNALMLDWEAAAKNNAEWRTRWEEDVKSKF